MENRHPKPLVQTNLGRKKKTDNPVNILAFKRTTRAATRMQAGSHRQWPVALLLLVMVISPLVGIGIDATPVAAEANSDTSDEIVYIDANGFIRVYDYQYSEKEVQWISPKGGWKDVALGDVNDDGDMEIAAIGTDPNDAIQIAIYDPVVSSGVTDATQEINGIPWDTLWEYTLPGYPELILAGDFDENIRGDEITYVYRTPTLYAVAVVLNTDPSASDAFYSDGRPTGRAWKEHVSYIDPLLGRRWKWGDSGDINGTGPDEVVLVDSKGDTSNGKSRFDVFDIAQGFLAIDGKSTDSDKILKVAVGQIIEDGSDEIAEVRSAKAAGNSLFVYKWDAVDNDLNRDQEWAFAGPESVFLADISGNGDKEVFILRKQPSDNGVRMIMVDKWGDDQDYWGENPDYPIEESLADLPNGTQNAYTLGEGGDVDGDGKDEVILISKEYIIIYPRPDETVDESSTIREPLAPYNSNNDTLAVGDLDSAGFATDPTFSISADSISASLQSGTKQNVATLEVKNVGTQDPVNYYFSGIPSWASFTPIQGSTPGTIKVEFDATSVSAGLYTSSVYVNSTEAVVNTPYEIQLEMTVSPVDIKLDVDPAQIGQTYYPCTAPISDTTEVVVSVTGGENLFFEAAILGVPSEVSSAGSQLTGEITGGEVDDEGWVTLYDENGNSVRYPGTRVSPEVSSSAIVTMTNTVDWITNAGYNSNQVPAEIRFTIDPSVLGTDFTSSKAVLVLVADSRAGLPPDNVTIVPIVNMCVAPGNRAWAPTLNVFSD